MEKKNGCINFIDIGHKGQLEKLSDEEIISKISNRFDYVQLNGKVAEFLIERFELKSIKKLNDILKAKLLIITYGKDGAEFMWNNNNCFYQLQNPAKELDPTGAGDLFYAIAIEHIIKNDFKINKRLIDKIYKEATLQTSKLVKEIGARALVQQLYEVNVEKGKCSCGLEIKEQTEARKSVKKISSNIANLGKRIKSDFNSKAYGNMKKVLENIKGNTILCGTGGSYAASYYAARVINFEKGIFAEAYLPRDIIYKKLESIDNIIVFSYSGTTNDIIQALKYAKKQNKYMITKGKLVECDNCEVISYLNSRSKTGRERGFLSIEGTVFPASLFAKYFYELEYKKDDFEEFLLKRLEYWKSYFKQYFKENKLKEILKNKNIIDVFYGDYTNTAKIDLESKIVETGIYRATFHEKKNFSHGRFISLEKYCSDVVIYLKTDNNSKYEEKLLEYLSNKAENLIVINTPYNNLLGEFDLLIAMQYFIKNISDMLDIDLSKPDYSEESMKIYKYKGMLD